MGWFGDIGNAVGGAANAVGGAVGGAANAVGNTAKDVGRGVGSAANAVGNTANNVGRGVGDAFGRDGCATQLAETLPVVGYGVAGVHKLAGNESHAKRAAARSTAGTVMLGVGVGAAAAAPVTGGASLLAVGAAGAAVGSVAGGAAQAAIEKNCYDEKDIKTVGQEQCNKSAGEWVGDAALCGVGGAAGKYVGKAAGTAGKSLSRAVVGESLKEVGGGGIQRWLVKRAIEGAVQQGSKNLAKSQAKGAAKRAYRMAKDAVATGEVSVVTITVASGVDSRKKMVSAHQDGCKVDLWTHEDGSGRQLWVLVALSDGSFNIRASGGTDDGREFLSCLPDGRMDLWKWDENNGRQRWFLIEQSNGTFHIEVAGGTDKGRKVLSCTQDGETLDLWSHDDNSGRQQWRIDG